MVDDEVDVVVVVGGVVAGVGIVNVVVVADGGC